MKKKNKTNRAGFSNFGFSTILIVFVMICIVTFSALAFLTASSDYKLSKKIADRTSNYYQAEELACRKLSEIDSILTSAYMHSRKEQTYLKKAYQDLNAYALNDSSVTVQKTDTISISFPVVISEQDTLNVSLNVCYPPDAGGVCYELTGWQTVTELLSDEE